MIKLRACFFLVFLFFVSNGAKLKKTTSVRKGKKLSDYIRVKGSSGKTFMAVRMSEFHLNFFLPFPLFFLLFSFAFGSQLKKSWKKADPETNTRVFVPTTKLTAFLL